MLYFQFQKSLALCEILIEIKRFKWLVQIFKLALYYLQAVATVNRSLRAVVTMHSPPCFVGRRKRSILQPALGP